MPTRSKCIQTPVSEQIEQSASHSNLNWSAEATSLLYNLALRQELLTAGDLHSDLQDASEQAPDLRALGSIFLKAKKLGYIEKIGYQRRHHQNNVTVLWRSCIRNRSTTSK